MSTTTDEMRAKADQLEQARAATGRHGDNALFAALCEAKGIPVPSDDGPEAA